MSRHAHLRPVYVVFVLLLAGCTGPPTPPGADSAPGTPQGSGGPVSPLSALPGAGAMPGWTPISEAKVFDTETLYDLVNGQADAFFAYAFEQVAVGDYEHADGAALRIEIWQLATSADAYGLFTTHRSGTAVPIGDEGDGDPGRRLDFWQDRYFVRLFSVQAIRDSDLQAIAQMVADALPAGAEPPMLLSRLPQAGLMERDTIFYREEISIQSHLWLGGQNLLALGPETEGVLARYTVGDETATLLLVHYPDAEAALAALEALRAGGLDSLAAADVQGDLLGAVFGAVSESQARALLADAFKDG
jgi:hypothetical protein